MVAEAKGYIGWDDRVSQVTFSGPTWELELDNAKDPRPSYVARSVDADADNTKFFITLQEPISTSWLVLNATNGDIDCEWKVTIYQDNLFTTIDFATAVERAFHEDANLVDPDIKGHPIIMDLGEERTFSYALVEIFNEDNTDGFFEFGNLFLPGKTLTPTRNFSSAQWQRDPNTISQDAVSGTPYFSRHRNMRMLSLTYPTETVAKAWDEIDVMTEVCGLDGAVFVVPYPDDTLRRHRQSFLGRLRSLDALERLMTAHVATGFQIKEYVG